MFLINVKSDVRVSKGSGLNILVCFVKLISVMLTPADTVGFDLKLTL